MKIGALIVTYNPDLERLKENIKSTITQVDYCVIVDNGSTNIKDIVSLISEFGIYLIKLKKNSGIATAQNEGFKHFVALKFVD